MWASAPSSSAGFPTLLGPVNLRPGGQHRCQSRSYRHQLAGKCAMLLCFHLVLRKSAQGSVKTQPTASHTATRRLSLRACTLFSLDPEGPL